jgi:hypothetical protein
MEKKSAIGFQLIGVRTEQFAIVEPDFDTNTPLEITANFEIGKDETQKVLSLLLLAKFSLEDRPIIILECSCHFKIEDESWTSFKDPESNALIMPKGFITHLAVITVGTARGILHAKTEGTKFNGFLLPTLNVSEVFPTEVRIE